MPDCAMVFFLTAALYAVTRYLVEDEASRFARLTESTALLTLAYLAKPVATFAVVPLLGLLAERKRAARPMRPLFAAVLIALPLLVLRLYDRRLDSHAEWHWASGITRLHVLPALRDALTTAQGVHSQSSGSSHVVLGLLRDTLSAKSRSALTIACFVALPWVPSRSKTLLWAWLAGGLAYVYVVVTVERVDYYMYPLLPLCALVIGGAAARFVTYVRTADIAPIARYALLALVPIVAVAALLGSRAPIAPYYDYNKEVYRNAVELDRTLPKDALVVIGHYGPDVQYYIDRFGWEEDPALWTPFDEESAIRKGARYFISIEDGASGTISSSARGCSAFRCAPPLRRGRSMKRIPAKVSPQAERFWRGFRNAQRAGTGRAFLDAARVCRVTNA